METGGSAGGVKPGLQKGDGVEGAGSEMPPTASYVVGHASMKVQRLQIRVRMNAQKRIGIIGGGLAGLTAAYRLQRAGAKVVVFESNEYVGGRTRTDRGGGYTIDTATQLYGSMYSEVRGLAREVGLADAWYRSSGRDALWRNGRPHEVIYGSVPSMLASGGLPMRTKLKLGTTYLPYLGKMGDYLDLHELHRAVAGGMDEESIQTWGNREIGPDFVEYLVYPLLASYYGSDPAETTAALYHLLARQGMDVSVHALRGGAGQLCEAIAEQIRSGGGEVRLGTPITGLNQNGRGLELTGRDRLQEQFDGAIVATPAPAAQDLLSEVEPEISEWLGGVRYRPALSVAFLTDGPARANYFGLSFPRDESAVLSAICLEENKAPGLVPAGKGLMIAFPSPAAAPRLMEMEVRDIAESLLPEIGRPFPRVDQRLDRVKVYRWKNGHAIFYPGYLKHLSRYHAGDIGWRHPITIAGDYLRFPNTEGAVTSGGAAAISMLQTLAARSVSER